MRRPLPLLLVVLALAGCAGPGGPSGDGATTARVTSVTDGDTFRTADGERVRLIGIDTPELRPEAECFGREASAELERLVGGRAVALVGDREPRDRFGRLLAYVRAGDVDVNAALVRGGFATTLEVEPNTARRAALEALEREARAAGRGLWSACDG